MRASAALAVAVIALLSGVWIKGQLTSPSDKALAVPIPAQPGADGPSVLKDAPPALVGRSAAATRGFSVTVKSDELASFAPMPSGALQLEISGQTRSFPIIRGEAFLPADIEPEAWRSVEVSGADGAGLFLRLLGPPPDHEVRCYAYPGYFLVSSAKARESLSAFQATSSLEILRPCAHPWTSEKLQEVPVHPADDADYAYVRAFSSERSFYFLHSPGFAWQKIHSEDVRPGHVVDLQLEPAGDVVFQGPQLGTEVPPRLIVRLGTVLVMRPKLDDVQGQVLPGWRPGSYTAFLASSISATTRDSLSNVAEFEVRPGATTTVGLELADELEGAAVGWGRLEGTLRFQAWELIQPWHEDIGLMLRVEQIAREQSLQFKGLKPQKKRIPPSRMELIDAPTTGDPAWRWDVGEYPEGRYRIHIDPLRWFLDVSVRPGETSMVEIEVPKLARTVIDLSVQVQDSTSVTAFLSHPEGAYPDASNPAPDLIAGEGGSLHMISSPGHYALAVLWKGKAYEQEISLHPGWNAAYFAVDDVLMATIDLVTPDGAPHALERNEWDGVVVRSQDGTPSKVTPVHVYRVGFSRARVVFDKAGLFEITGIEGLELASTAGRLELEDGAKRELVVDPR